MRNVSILRIYYPFVNTNIYTTDILYTWQELIGNARVFTCICVFVETCMFFFFLNIVGNFGGMLGLCIGLSIIGAIEVIYFATIKLAQNLFCSKEVYNVHSLKKDLYSSKNLEKHLLQQQWAMPKRQLRPQYF